MNFDIEIFNTSLDSTDQPDSIDQPDSTDQSVPSRTVFIANQSGHDFSQSLKYGNPCFVTKGLINRFAVNLMARKWALALVDSKKEDYLLITSLTILNCIGCAIFGYLHQSINLLIYRNGKYIARTVCFKSLFETLSSSDDDNDEE